MKISKKTGNTILNISILAIFATALGIISSNALDCKQGCIITHCVWGGFGGGTGSGDCKWFVNANKGPVARCEPLAYTKDSIYFGKYCYSIKDRTFFTYTDCIKECPVPMTRGIDCLEPPMDAPVAGPVTMATACGASYPPTGY